MSVVESADLYRVGDDLLLAPGWSDQDGRWAWTSEFAQLPLSLTDAQLGVAIGSALETSRSAGPVLADVHAERERVDTARAAAAGMSSVERFTAAASWVSVSRDDDGSLYVAPSDAYGGPDPGFRLRSEYQALQDASYEQLGRAVRQALDRCTHTANP